MQGVITMAMKRCNNGHFYDSDKYTNCPYCGVQSLDVQATMAKRSFVNPGNVGPTEPAAANRQAGRDFRTVASNNAARSSVMSREPGETVGLMKRKTGIDPVVGWLVCIEGAERGRDYRIRSEKNSLGRSESMDICISADDTISRENHAFIVFNPKSLTFRVQAGESRGLVYLNNEEVPTYAELQPYDIIEIGQTKLMFVPFCGGNFQWN